MNIQEAYYELKFENAFYRAKGDEFQTFFEKIMGLAYKADFIACLPWGNQGDHKNDGFLKSERTLFQVYAPNSMSEVKAKNKITNDFNGAKSHWKTDFDKWVFVHNSIDGLPPHILHLLLDFERENNGIHLFPWCLEELRIIFRKISIEDKINWLGFAPTDETKAKLGFNDIQIVLQSITPLPLPLQTEVKDVPMGKIEANSLSESVTYLLKEGMIKSPLVENFFNHWHDEFFGERLAQAFTIKYKNLQKTLPPNQIFFELQNWVGGEYRGSPEHEMAVLAILAYYFERCDIFEEPKRNH